MSTCFSTGNVVLARVNLKPAVLKNFVFDQEICFLLCEGNRFQDLEGLELPIKHAQSLVDCRRAEVHLRISLLFF